MMSKINITVNKKNYFSPSQINSFIERRDGYIRNYVFGAPWKGNSSFGRGQAVELGLQRAVGGMDVDDACAAAWEFYKTYCRAEKLPKDDAEKITENEIYESVSCVADYYLNDLGAGPHVKTQEKIILKDKDLPREIMGFTDFGFPSNNPLTKKGPIRDLKTAAQTPSKLSAGYQLQGTVYRWATGRPVYFDTVVNLKKGSKVTTFQLEDDQFIDNKKIIIAAAWAMEEFWSMVPDVIDEDYYGILRALSFPNIPGLWSAREKSDMMEEYINNFKPTN